MSVDILGTNCDQCLWSMVECCFTSTETVRLIRTGRPGRPRRLSHSSWTLTRTALVVCPTANLPDQHTQRWTQISQKNNNNTPSLLQRLPTSYALCNTHMRFICMAIYHSRRPHAHSHIHYRPKCKFSTQTPSIHQQTCGSCTIYSTSFYIISNSLFPDHDAHSWTRASKHELKHETRPHRVKKEKKRKRVPSRFKRFWFYLCWCTHCGRLQKKRLL